MLINSVGNSNPPVDSSPKSEPGACPIMPPIHLRIVYSSGCAGLDHVYVFESQPNELVQKSISCLNLHNNETNCSFLPQCSSSLRQQAPIPYIFLSQSSVD